MAKDPCFPFYAQDYLVDTIRWSRAMQGLHVSLMAESWANGGLHDDNGVPAGLGSTDVELWLKIKHKWKLLSGMWISEKLEEVRAERIAFREKQREKGILSAKKRNQKSTNHQPKMSNGSTVVEPIESEDESEDEEVKGDVNSKLYFANEIFNDQAYVEQLKITHKGKDIAQAWEQCWNHFSVQPSPPEHTWLWKQKLNTWLINTKNGNGHSKTGSGGAGITPEGTRARIALYDND